MRHLPWALAVLAAFLFGLYLGQRQAAPAGAEGAADPAAATLDPVDRGRSAAAVATTLTEPAPAPPPVATVAGWSAALARLDQLSRQDAGGAAVEFARGLLDQVLELARGGDRATARQRLDAYLARNPFDGPAHLLAADLWQMQGRRDAALETLLALLEFADDPALIAQARDQLRVLVNVQESELASRGDVAGLVRYFQDLSARDPGYDGHRLRLAHWLLRAGRLDQAERTLAETGAVGIDPRAREDLQAALSLARTGLPLERQVQAGVDGADQASALHVRASAQGQGLRLLMDTGASTTALTRARADALGAGATGREVQVRTAVGVLDVEIRRLNDFEVGGLRIESLDVLVLDAQLPDGVDGLLGMDVLSRFPDFARGAPAAP